MKKIVLLSGCLCLTLTITAQSYRGSDADRMVYQRMQQNSQQNSAGNTYTPRQSPGGGSYNRSNNYNGNGYDRSSRSYSHSENEKVIQGVYVNNQQQAIVRLRYIGGKITHYSTSRDILGKENWQPIYPDNPHPTMSLQDGQMAKEYGYKVSIGGTTVYFNL